MTKNVAIIGAGISGLLSAYFLRLKGHEVTIFEKEKTGGKLQTTLSAFGPMESAANGILADSLVEEVCAEIGVKLIPTLKSSKARYIYSDGRPRRWPLGFGSSLSVARFLFNKPWRDESTFRSQDLKSWLRQYLPESAVDTVFSPACQGIFGVTTDKLSARLIMNYFFNKKKIPKGRLKGTVTALGGMSEITQKLEAHLRARGVVFKTQTVESLEPMMQEFTEVVVATDIVAAAQLLETIRDFRGSVFKSVPTVDLISINAFYKEPQSPYPGFGILFPRGEGVTALGVLQNTYIFPERSSNALSETWIYNFGESTSDDTLLNTLAQDRRTVLKSEAIPVHVKINRWPQALPLYGMALERALENMPPGHPRVHLMGNYLGEIGLNRLFQRARDL